MPTIPFDSLGPDARVWVFASDSPLDGAAESVLIREVDSFLAGWNAHGTPLVCARVVRDSRFLAIGVDEAATGASGCSIDGLYRTLQRLQPEIGSSLVPAGRVYWRDIEGAIKTADRAEFIRLAKSGEIDASTRVFDTAVTTAAAWREGFETAAGASWHAAFLPGFTKVALP